MMINMYFILDHCMYFNEVMKKFILSFPSLFSDLHKTFNKLELYSNVNLSIINIIINNNNIP